MSWPARLFNDLGDARAHRLFCSRLRLPRIMWALLLTNGCLTVGSMWLFGLKSFAAQLKEEML